MKEYKKPVVLSHEKKANLVPALAAAGLSAAGAFAVGVASGLMKENKNHLTTIPSINKVKTVD